MATLADLALWLTHVPERRDREMLLDRSQIVRHLNVLVVGRAADALNPLVAPSTWQGEALRAPPAQHVKAAAVQSAAGSFVEKN
jgi:hypothetical protein